MLNFSSKKSQGGASSLEAAICLPVILLAVLGLIDFSRYYALQNSLTAAATKAASFASVIKNLDKDDTDPLFASAKEAVIAHGKTSAAALSGKTSSDFSVQVVLPESPRPINMRDKPIEVITSSQFNFITPFISLFSDSGSFKITRTSYVFREQPWSSSTPVALDCRGNPLDLTDTFKDIPCSCSSDPTNPMLTTDSNGACKCITSSPDPKDSPLQTTLPNGGIQCSCPAGREFKNSYKYVTYDTLVPVTERRRYGCACPNAELAYTAWCPFFDSTDCSCHICDPRTSRPDIEGNRPNWCQCKESMINYCASLGMGVSVTGGPSGESSGACVCVPMPACPPDLRVYDPTKFGTTCGCKKDSPISCPLGQVLSNCACSTCPLGTIPNESQTACVCPPPTSPAPDPIMERNIHTYCNWICPANGVLEQSENGSFCKAAKPCPQGTSSVYSGNSWYCITGE